MGLHDDFSDLLLVSFGAILGANIRFIIFQKFERLNINKNSIILLINTFSSFLLGLSLSILSKIDYLIYSYQLGIFFLIGLLGSLSTFSTFIYDLYECLMKLKFYQAFKLFVFSLTTGVLAFALGFLLGMNE